MKSKLLLVGLLLLCVSSFAQKQKVTDVVNKTVVSSGTHFATQMTDKKWANTNGKSYTQASYANYDGITFVKLKALQTVEVNFQYAVTIKKGSLLVTVVDNQENIVFEKNITATEKGTFSLSLQGDKDYQLRFNGNQTKGAYFCQWLAMQ